MLKSSIFLRHSIKRVVPVPKQLWGRALGLLVQQQEQCFGFVGVYVLPRVSKKGQKDNYERAVSALCEWLQPTLGFFFMRDELCR
eukprot:5699591-Pyramimonas_sp.AAC.1